MPALNLDDFLPYRLSVASNRVSAAIATAYQSLFGLKIAEWRLIAVIAQDAGVAEAGLTQQALCARTQMDKVMVSRAATALVERGLVHRAPNPEDQRSHLLTLSEEGQRLYQAVAPKALELEAQIFAGLDAATLISFRDVLARIETAAALLDPSPENRRL